MSGAVRVIVAIVDCPTGIEAGASVIVNEVASGATARVADAIEARKFPCAGKLVDREWLPTPRTPTLNIAEPFTNAAERAAPPSTLNCTLPVTIPPEEPTETPTLPGVPYVIPGAVIAMLVAMPTGWKMANGESEREAPQTVIVVVFTLVVMFAHAPF